MNGKRIGVLIGGDSRRRESSLASAAAVAQALVERGNAIERILLQDPATWMAVLQQARVDIAFPILQGPGELFHAREMCEELQIPCAGSDLMATELANNEIQSRKLFTFHNVPIPSYYAIPCAQPATELAALHGSFGYPVLVKPSARGTGIPSRMVQNESDFCDAVLAARSQGHDVLVQRFVEGRQVHVGILNGRVLGSLEVETSGCPTSGAPTCHIPVRIAATRHLGVLNLAIRAASSLGCTGACCVSMIVTDDANEYVLGVDTTPALTETSFLPQIAASAGFGLADLCEAMINGAVVRSSASTHAGVIDSPSRQPQPKPLAIAV